MTLDRRFPDLQRFASDRRASAAARAKVSEIERRTGTNAIINKGGRITFRYGDSLGGPFAIGLAFVERWHGGDVDDAVRIIQSGKLSAAQKDKIAANNKAREDHEKAEFEARCFEDTTPLALDHVAHNDRARRGVTTLISA